MEKTQLPYYTYVHIYFNVFINFLLCGVLKWSLYERVTLLAAVFAVEFAYAYGET